MKNLVKSINENFAAFTDDAAAQVEKGNKAAGTRARKASLAIEKQLKEFRKSSIAAAK
ncbi:histone H1 [Bacteroidia bacterium]|nr:histone H1 [Bacteroidia bacterium]